jgi:actin-related protein
LNLVETTEYELPDGKKINLDQEKHILERIFTGVKEIGGFQGVHKLAVDSIFNCELDSRKEIYQNIIVTGGNSCFTGFNDRLQKFIFLNSPQNIKTKVIELLSNNYKSYTPFLGASILTSLGSFNQLWITQAEYNDFGSFVIEKKSV